MNDRRSVGARATGVRVGHLFMAAVALLACHACGGSGGNAQLTEPGPPSSFAPGCGMSLFTEPACEAYLDQRSCAQQDQCSRNAGCMRVVKCWNECEAQRKLVASQGTGAGCACFQNCFPQGHETPGIKEFMRIIALVQDGPPPGLSCRSGC